MPLIDSRQLQTLRDLAAGDESFLATVIDAFLPQLEMTPRALRQAIAEGAYERVADLAHSLKGSSGNVGAAEVTRLSQKIESLARSGEGASVGPLLDELETAARATRELLEGER